MISVKSVAQTKKKKKIMKEKKMLEETKEKETYGKTGTDRGGLTEELREREREMEGERERETGLLYSRITILSRSPVLHYVLAYART